MQTADAITQFFDHLRFDFNIKGVIVFNGHAGMQRVYIAGYPYVRNEPVNDNGYIK